MNLFDGSLFGWPDDDKTINHLAGQVILDINMIDDEFLIIKTKKDEQEHIYSFRAAGDCCSQSWLESFDDYQLLIGQRIIAINPVELGEVEPTPEKDCCEKLYKVEFICEQARADLIFRNNSNGYYGGYLDIVEKK